MRGVVPAVRPDAAHGEDPGIGDSNDWFNGPVGSVVELIMRIAKILAFTWLALVISCSPSPDPGGGGGGGNPGGGPPPPGNPEPLVVEATDPQDAELGAPLQQSITITFNVAVAPATVTAQSIYFTSPLGPVDGVLSVQDNAVTFIPTQDYPIACPITGTVTIDVVGANNEVMAEDFEWTFGTESIPVVIAEGDGIEQPCVAVSADGLALAMWVQNDGGTYRLFARDWQPATLWEEAVEFVVSGEKISSLRLSCTENNEAVAFWVEGAAVPYSIRTARFTAGQGWGATETLTDSCSNTWVAFDMHRGGWGGAIYYAMGPDGWDVMDVRYLNPDGTWNDPVGVTFWLDNLSAGGDGALYSSHSFTDSDSGYNYGTRYFPGWGSVYVDVESASGAIEFGSAGDSDGGLAYFISMGDVSVWRSEGEAWASAGTIDVPDDGYTSYSDLATAPGGEAVLTWDVHAPTSVERNLMGAFMDAEGNWTGAESLESLETLVFDPVAACTDAGEGWVVFQQDDGTAGSIWFARYVPGTGWAAAVEIDDDDFGSTEPKLAAQGPGGCAVWLRQNGTTQLMARILN